MYIYNNNKQSLLTLAWMNKKQSLSSRSPNMIVGYKIKLNI